MGEGGATDEGCHSGWATEGYLFSNSGMVGQSWRGYAVEKLETAACAQSKIT